MDFLDNLKSQSASWLTNFAPQILESGLKSTGLIKVSTPPTSNLTANQVAQGQSGSIQNMQPSGGGMSKMMMIGGVVLVGILGLFLVMKKGK